MCPDGNKQIVWDDDERKEINLKALEDLVNVNSLFTIAVFIGLTFTATPNHVSLEQRPECMADTRMGKRVIVFEIISFALFLFSSQVAKSLKIYINMYGIQKSDKLEVHWVQGLLFLLSVLASIAGVVLLAFSLAYVVEIKVGKMSCGTEALHAVVPLVAFVEITMCPDGNKQIEWKDDERKEINLKALEDLVNVNSLFTIAVFIGLTFTATPNHVSLEQRPECMADTRMGKRVIVFEIISFALFLFSSQVAKSLKIYINMYGIQKSDKLEVHWVQGLLFLLSVLASIAGVVLLAFSLAYVGEIKVGKMSCGTEALHAVVPLVAFVGLAMLIYLFSMCHAIRHCMV
ncbi:hypothetical protein JCGZ_15082 [Jatropha curcas]|uniref:Uncharacterized protein n=1 Tax=Jatropha curcas TaxID=180498 RepID=A0A067LA22_JATCU|nr:hypothetical protein JCGZ_15082 [Jatropha curcas]